MKITLRGKGNVFEQIADEYIRLIDIGVFEPEEKLPSCRALAKDLGINPNTVEKAYALLEEKGYIMTIPKKGAYVLSRDANIKLRENIKTQIQSIMKNISYDELIDIINQVYKG